MHIGITCLDKQVGATVRYCIPWTCDVSSLPYQGEWVTRVRELDLDVLFLHVAQAGREDAARWKDIFAGGRTDLVLLWGCATRDQFVRALRCGVYDVLPPLSEVLENELPLLLQRVTRERYSRRPGEIFIREFAEALITTSGRRVLLTRTEYQILRVLIEHGGRFLSPDCIREQIWGGSAIRRKTDLYVHISRLREKLEAEPGHSRIIASSRGLGYAFVGEVADCVKLA